MRALIRLFDRFLRWRLGVFEFCEDPSCLIRLRLARAPHSIPLSDGEIPAGAKLLELHLWNERVQRMPPEGADLRMAIGIRRMFIFSCQAAAREMQHNPRFSGIEVVGGITVLFYPGEGSGGEKLFKRLGFTLFPYHNPLGRFGEFWENLFTWSLMWAYNAPSLRQRHLLRLHRTEMWMSAKEFILRYGASAANHDAQAGNPHQVPTPVARQALARPVDRQSPRLQHVLHIGCLAGPATPDPGTALVQVEDEAKDRRRLYAVLTD